MPTEFLKDRYKRFLHETSGTTTVGYEAYLEPTPDPVTGDVTESSAYAGTPVSLPARVNYMPTRALRALAGRDISFEAMIRLSTEDLADNNITLKIGDVFYLPDQPTKKRFVVKIEERKQAVEEFIEVMVLVDSKEGSRG